ncbi:unnamed protein product [Vitrella brassicaformis CCMP3155]|uniref:Uncharacterized protein n=1 Tax=Vitrella brassicaformis (strain CCMP3155) TaxID=1169540 RepID=A0A0G4EF48_VITBC|nr:unnamed protein product [Vitrella brassicaformis CCMP3155]|eukprot:CEL94349.1 unnamed protein product [Vitrella brassicaformis CCMP3155]
MTEKIPESEGIVAERHIDSIHASRELTRDVFTSGLRAGENIESVVAMTATPRPPRFIDIRFELQTTETDAAPAALGVIQEEEQPTAEEQSQVVKALGWSPGRKLSVRVSKVSITYRCRRSHHEMLPVISGISLNCGG